jgi:hypothetical protein
MPSSPMPSRGNFEKWGADLLENVMDGMQNG